MSVHLKKKEESGNNLKSTIVWFKVKLQFFDTQGDDCASAEALFCLLIRYWLLNTFARYYKSVQRRIILENKMLFFNGVRVTFVTMYVLFLVILYFCCVCLFSVSGPCPCFKFLWFPLKSWFPWLLFQRVEQHSLFFSLLFVFVFVFCFSLIHFFNVWALLVNIMYVKFVERISLDSLVFGINCSFW